VATKLMLELNWDIQQFRCEEDRFDVTLLPDLKLIPVGNPVEELVTLFCKQ
jgi:hypothetical protein